MLGRANEAPQLLRLVPQNDPDFGKLTIDVLDALGESEKARALEKLWSTL